ADVCSLSLPDARQILVVPVVPLNAQAAVHETPLAPDRAASAADQLLREPTNADVREVASAPSSSHLRLSIEPAAFGGGFVYRLRSEEHTSDLQSRENL